MRSVEMEVGRKRPHEGVKTKVVRKTKAAGYGMSIHIKKCGKAI